MNRPALSRAGAVSLCLSFLLLAAAGCNLNAPKVTPEPASPIPTKSSPPTIISTQGRADTPIVPPTITVIASPTPIAPPTVTATPIVSPTPPPTAIVPPTLLPFPPLSRFRPLPGHNLIPLRTLLAQGLFVVNELSGKCVTARDGVGSANGIPLQLGDCEFDRSTTNQKWKWVNEGFLQNASSGKCLDVNGLPGVRNEDPIQIWDCEFSVPGKTDQVWKISDEGFLVNTMSGKCLDVRGLPGTSNGDPLQLWDCEYGDPNSDQRWYFR